MGKPCRSNSNATEEILACPWGYNCLTRLPWENSLILKTVGKNRKAEPCAQGLNIPCLLHPFLCFSELSQHRFNTVKGLGSLQLLSNLTGKSASSEASLPLRFIFRISTIKKQPQPRSWSSAESSNPPWHATKKKPEKHQGTMVNALLRMCLKRISAKSWDYRYYKSHLFDTKRLW